MKQFLLLVFFSIICHCIHAQDYMNRVLSDMGRSGSIDSSGSIPFTSRPDTGFVGVYELAPDTFVMTFECSIGSYPTLYDSIFSEVDQRDTFFRPENDFSRSLSTNKKLSQSFKKHFKKYYYVYGTKGYQKCKIGIALYYSGSCKCFYGVMLTGYNKIKYGNPLFTYPSELPISYDGDYTGIQALLNEEKKAVMEDTITGANPYFDKIYPTVFSNIGSRYFVYSDTFGSDECKFPERMIYDMPNNGRGLTLIWFSEPDFFGSPCD